MVNYTSKFSQLHESAFSRYTQGGGFLAGDVVKFKKNTPQTEWFRGKAKATQDLILGMMQTPGNLRIGILKGEYPMGNGTQYSTTDQESVKADIYVELAPGNWAYPMTVPLTTLERVERGNDIGGPVPDSVKDKDRVTIKGESKAKDTGLRGKETKVDDVNRQTATANKALPGGKKWDDSKPGGGNAKQSMPKSMMKESTTLEGVFDQMLTEGTENDPYEQCDFKHEGGGATVTFQDTIYSSVVDDEIPVTVTGKFTLVDGEWVLGGVSATDERGKGIKVDPKDVDYLTGRATDFVTKHTSKTEVEEASGDDSVDVGGHTVTRIKKNTGGSDPAIKVTFKFDNGYEIVEFFGDHELKDSAGKRIAYASKVEELNVWLHRLGLPSVDEVYDAFDKKDQSPEDTEAAYYNSLMGDPNP